MQAKFSRFNTGFKIAEIEPPIGGHQDIRYGMFTLAFGEKNLNSYLTSKELLAFTSELAGIQGCVVVDGDDIVALMDNIKEYLWRPESDSQPIDTATFQLLDKVRDFCLKNNLNRP